MATTSTYPIVTPKVEDLIVGTQTYTEEDPVLNNPTSNFTVESIVSLVESNLGVNKIIAGQGLTISPSNGKGDVTISVPTAPQWLTSDAVVTNGVVNYISNLLIPTGSTSVGDYAFLNMNITAIDFNSQAITSIGANAFAINKLKGTLTLPSTLLTIGNYAFQDNGTTTNQIELIEFGNQLTSIGEWVFYKNAITSLSIPSSVTAIGTHAFQWQRDMYSLDVEARTLTSLAFEPRATVLTLSDYAFSDNYITSVSIPANTIIGNFAFSNNVRMSSLTIGDNSTVGQNSFKNNTNISSLTIGDNVNFSGGFAFSAVQQTDVLTSVNIPTSTTFTSIGTFVGRLNLTTFTIGNEANYFWPQTINSGVVPGDLFRNCGLTEVSIDSNVTVGVSAFRSNPLTSISIGENVTINQQAFRYGTGAISAITIPGTTIFPTDSSSQFSASNITSLIIEEGITEIPNSFANASGVTNVTFPSSLVNIRALAFYNNNISGTLNFASIITIEQQAFQLNPGITTVNVPIGSTIASNAFDSGVTINYV